MPAGLQYVIVGIAVALALGGAFVSLAPVRWRLGVAAVLEGWLPAGLVARLRPRGGGGARRAAR
jgi:hypothetical protein